MNRLLVFLALATIPFVDAVVPFPEPTNAPNPPLSLLEIGGKSLPLSTPETAQRGATERSKEASDGVVESGHGDTDMAVSTSDRAGSREGAGLAVRGIATWYGGKLFAGKAMANGEPFNEFAMTTASNSYPLGTVLEVEYRSVVTVTVTDRGNFGHLLDLSRGAFHSLVKSNEPGVISVTVRALE